MKKAQKAYFLIALVILFWSTVATAFKIALRYLSVASLLFVASLTSLVLLFTVLISTNGVARLKNLRFHNFIYFAFLSLLNPFLYYLVLFKAYALLPAQVAQPLNYTWPIVLSIFSVIFLKEKVSIFQILAIFLSFIGASIIVAERYFGVFAHISAFGVFLALLSAFVWASFWILNVKNELPAVLKLFLNFLFGTVYIGIFLLLTGGLQISPEGIPPAIFVGVFEMGITYLLFLKAISLYNTAVLSNLVYLSPFVSLLFIHLFLGETIALQTILGLFLIVSGIVLNGVFAKQVKE